MRLRTITVFAWGFLVAGAALAGEQHRVEIAIAGDGSDRGEFRFSSEDSGVDPYALEVGESKTYTDDDGNEVTVSRSEDGFEFDVAGEKIVVDDVMHEEHDLKMLHLAHEGEDVIVEKHRKIHLVDTDDEAGVTIISGDEIDAETRARIEKVLKEAGKHGEVLFIDGSELSGNERAAGKREVRIIKKKIDATN